MTLSISRYLKSVTHLDTCTVYTDKKENKSPSYISKSEGIGCIVIHDNGLLKYGKIFEHFLIY
jgi:hypothetical protein